MEHKCVFCGETDVSRFYGNKKSRCSTCHNEDTKNKYRQKRAKAIEYKGGKCQVCGFDKYKDAFDFHHVNENIKDKGFNNMGGWRWDRIKKEIDNCVLLCANCHRGVHSGEVELNGV